EPVDEAVGLARARAATLMMLALPSSAYLYQGEELRLPEVFDPPDEVRQDPRSFRTYGQALGTDGCQVAVPWSGTAPPFGYGPAGSRPWLPHPAGWSALTVEAQRRDPESTWSMYRDALALRRRMRLGLGELAWLEPPAPEVLGFSRTCPGGTLICAINCGDQPVRLPAEYGAPVRASGGEALSGRVLPPDTAVWTTPAGPATPPDPPPRPGPAATGRGGRGRAPRRGLAAERQVHHPAGPGGRRPGRAEQHQLVEQVEEDQQPGRGGDHRVRRV